MKQIASSPRKTRCIAASNGASHVCDSANRASNAVLNAWRRRNNSLMSAMSAQCARSISHPRLAGWTGWTGYSAVAADSAVIEVAIIFVPPGDAHGPRLMMGMGVIAPKDYSHGQASRRIAMPAAADALCSLGY